MKRKVTDFVFFGYLTVCIGFILYIFLYIPYSTLHSDYEKIDLNLTIYKENIPLDLKVNAKTDNKCFNFHYYGNKIEELVKEVAVGGSCEELINNPQKLTNEVKKRFNEPDASLDFLSITVTPPAEFTEAEKNLRVAALTLQKDSMISTSSKHDAIGYTPEAERLEERRDARFNAQEDRRIKLREIESNEKIKLRQAEAIEKAADNMGLFSGDLAIKLH